ncbi:MAG: hypothetical protein M3Z26_16680 [Bacteroidota bacterium]|nr:hypothetical protein [Bacteroidota bacterium]
MKLFKIVFALFVTAMLFNACSKEYSVENGGLKLPVGNWEFVNGSASYSGNMDSAYIISGGATKELHLDGTSIQGNQNFHLVLYSDSFRLGTYKASLFQSNFAYTTTAKTIYQASQLIGEFIVNITSFSNGLIVGTFSGTAKDSSNNLKQITAGKFKATFGNAGATPTSSGVLGDSLGNCKPVILNGPYIQGIAMTAANTVQVQVVVAVAGSYTITTNLANGVAFSNTGMFSNTGVQNILLNASGTPLLSGDQVYTLHYGNSQCAFKITFLPGMAPTGDYFPLTVNSNWTYGLDGGTPADSIYRTVIGYSLSVNGNTYNTITQSQSASSPAGDSSYYRKPGGDYYQYMDFSQTFHFDNPVKQEFIFLKDNVPANTTWQSATINATIGGMAFSGYAKMTLLSKAVPVTIGSFDFPDVIKVKYELFITGVPVAIQTEERWFAKNVGEIYTSTSDGTNTETFQVGQFHIF